jgi:putative inorganic carbon (HCO3(-)) transporter
MGLGLTHYIPLVAYLGFWVMCLISLGWKPLWGFYYLIPFLPYRTMRDHFLVYPLGNNILTILVLSILIGALIKGKRLPKSNLYVIWLVSIVYLYVSMWFGAALGNAPIPLWISDGNFAVWKDYCLIPLVFVAASLVIEDRKSIRTVVILAAITLLLIDKSALGESMSRSFAHFDEDKRDAGPLGLAGANGLAAFLAQFGLFFWGFTQYVKSKKYKLSGYGLVAVTVFATLYTFSRASYIALVLGVIVLGILKDRKLLLVVFAFLLTWQTLVPVAVTERVKMTENSSGQLEASAGLRIQLWEEAKVSMMSNPIFGTGYDTFEYGTHAGNLRDTHNWYVKVMVETGLIGIAFALLIFQQMLSVSYRLFKQAKDPLYRGLGLGLVLAIVASLILNCFGDRWNFLEIIGLLWVLIAAALRAAEFDAMPRSESVAVADKTAPSNPYLVYR